MELALVFHGPQIAANIFGAPLVVSIVTMMRITEDVSEEIISAELDITGIHLESLVRPLQDFVE